MCVEENKQNKVWQQKIQRKNMNNKIQQVRDQQAREEREFSFLRRNARRK